ncbi:MAG: alpha/beta hydrolase, partial [Deltaproteobacteria bacterium]|nr:alpha/beta hydrolase [Deltaproteobacteria bacterium]
MFEYFPDNYGWSQSVAIALLLGCNIHEIDEVCKSMKEMALEPEDPGVQEAWYEGWNTLAKRLQRQAGQDLDAGRELSAGRKLISASQYYMLAERHITNLDPRKLEAYNNALDTWNRGTELRGDPVKRVEIPYGDVSLPGIFIPAVSDGPAPCMVFFNGGDSIKEMLYFSTGFELRNRGISLLIFDNPGAGESLRLRDNYMIPESEIPAGACVDYLEGRADVDLKRIGVMGLSLGGYHAPRSAAFEKRFKCCVAWAAAWEFGGFASRIASGESETTGLAFQLAWMFGKTDPQEAVKIAMTMTLEGVAEKITCPLLVVHGENDRFSDVGQAEKTISAAINSPNKELKIFTPED